MFSTAFIVESPELAAARPHDPDVNLATFLIDLLEHKKVLGISLCEDDIDEIDRKASLLDDNHVHSVVQRAYKTQYCPITSCIRTDGCHHFKELFSERIMPGVLKSCASNRGKVYLQKFKFEDYYFVDYMDFWHAHFVADHVKQCMMEFCMI